jgi:hypothetical protein
MTNASSSSTYRIVLKKLMPIVSAIGVLTTGLALLSYSILGFFSRYYADDYCMSGLVFQRGFWQAQVEQYTSWSNRYAGMLVLSLSELLGRSAIRVWTALVIFLLVASLAWTLAQFNRWLNLSLSRWLLVLLAELAVFFTILFSPQLYQSLFWRIGLITYTLPLVFLVFLIGLIIFWSVQTIPGQIPWKGVIACFLLAFFAGGFSETYITLQTSLFFFGFVVAAILARNPSRRNWLSMMIAALGGSLLALAIVLAAPGNAVRQAAIALPTTPVFLTIVKMVVTHAFLFMYRTLAANSLQTVLAVLTPLLLVYGFYSGREIPRWRPSLLVLALLLVPATGFVTIAVVMTPAAYIQSSYPDGRVLVQAGFIMASMLMIMGVLTGVMLSLLHRWAEEPVPPYLQGLVALLAVILLLYPLYDARKNTALLPEYRARAVSWDARDAHIRAARQKGIFDIQEKGLNAPYELTEMKPDPADWVNICATWFYDIKSITAGTP